MSGEWGLRSVPLTHTDRVDADDCSPPPSPLTINATGLATVGLGRPAIELMLGQRMRPKRINTIDTIDTIDTRTSILYQLARRDPYQQKFVLRNQRTDQLQQVI